MVELSSIIILGILAQWLAWRTKIPAILPLILIGLVVGPISSLWTEGGQKWIEPMHDNEEGYGIFPGQYLFYFVSLSIGLILFEGGLTLKRSEIKNVGPSILRLVTLGSLITFVGAGLATHYIMGLSWLISFLFAALIIVTGPTVIAPILQNVPLKRNVSTVLKWEGILIDPIGALVAVLVFEFIISGQGGFEFTSHALISFVQILLIGLALGTLAAFFLDFLIKKSLIPHYLLNVFTLALVLAVFVFSDILAHESGLLTVVVMGMVLGNQDVAQLKEILYFKESISILLISMLFILLAANINMEDLSLLLNWSCLGLFGLILLLRPLGVFASTRDSGLNIREKLFISWVGPRGIVAAGIASLFGLKLMNDGVPGAQFITPLVFMVVLGTVLLNATTARLVAKMLGVTLDSSDGVLLIGANTAARVVAQYLQETDRHVVLVDSNKKNVAKCKKQGLECLQLDIYNDELIEQFDLLDIGYLIAMTGSSGVNEYACNQYTDLFGEKGTYRLISEEERTLKDTSKIDCNLFSPGEDFVDISEAARDYPQMNEIAIRSHSHFVRLVQLLKKEPKSIPLFIKNPDNRLQIITGEFQNMTVDENSMLIYLGKEIKLPEDELTETKLKLGE